VAVLSGRVHRYEGYSQRQVVFPVRVLGRLGVKTLLLTNAAGSVNVNYKPGELMVIDDHINYMGFNPLVGPNQEELGPRFFDMSDTYDAELRQIALTSITYSGIQLCFSSYLVVFLTERAALGLVEAGAAFSMAMIAGIIGRVLASDAGDLLLELGEALELRLRHVGEVIGPFLKLAG